MIFGVPVGTQTIVMNLDLSDMGPFSLTPADLIRMGIATETQFDGTKFKSSPNFNELPQIVVINKTIEVVPFWGQPDICQIGITRSDFDITSSSNVDIKPTAVFMGSLMSSSETSAIKTDNTTQKETGELCKMIVGPGEIIAVTQTIYQDANGLPMLEKATLPDGGKLIDENGTWMFDLPMNLDYVYTNEFGEQLLSNDPSVGIPTKGKYRFKIKWQQSKSISEDYKRAYYLVPNIREKGWVSSANDPSTGGSGFNALQTSYAFSTDWSAYTVNTPLNITNPEIATAVNCEDVFYQFDYNKVYTVSQLVDNYKNTDNREKFIGIKRIDDFACETTNNKYPVNDGVFHASLMWRIYDFILTLFGTIGYLVLFIYSLIAFLWDWILTVLYAWFTFLVVQNIASAFTGVVVALTPPFPSVGTQIWAFATLAAWLLIQAALTFAFKKLIGQKFPPIKLPMMTYPDCDVCDCGETILGAKSGGADSGGNGFMVPYNYSNGYPKLTETFISIDPVTGAETTIYGFNLFFSSTTTGADRYYLNDSTAMFAQLTGEPDTKSINYGVPVEKNNSTNPASSFYTFDLPFGERINLFNAKTNYYNDTKGGPNRVTVTYEPALNPGIGHTDNVVAFIIQAPNTGFTAGTMFTTVNPSSSKDPNLKTKFTNIFGNKNLTGTTNYSIYAGGAFGFTLPINYADPTNRINNLTSNYVLPIVTGSTGQTIEYSYPADIEYFQVITGMTVAQMRQITSSGSSITAQYSFANLIEGKTVIMVTSPGWFYGERELYYPYGRNTAKMIDAGDPNSIVIFAQRGVDPYSPKYNTRVDLTKLFGTSTPVVVTTKLRLNQPILNTNLGAGRQLLPNHNNIPTNASTSNGFNLFFSNYGTTWPAPGLNVKGVQTGYTSFDTTLTKYYSNIDYNSVLNPFPLKPSNPIITYTWLAQYGTDITAIGNIFNSSLQITSVDNNIFYSQPTDGEGILTADYNFPVSISTVYNNVIPFTGRTNYISYVSAQSFDGASYMFKGGAINGGQFNYPNDPKKHNGRYFSNIYSATTTTMSDRTRLLMRSDRLPSSDKFQVFSDRNFCKLLQQNELFTVYTYSDVEGEVAGISTSSGQYGGGTITQAELDDNSYLSAVTESFNCGSMVQLSCYTGNSLGDFGIDPGCPGADAVDNGCYVFVTEPLVGIVKDVKAYTEWLNRFRFFYGLCQGVLSNVFNNNWINGNLYAFPFKVNTYFDNNNVVSSRQYPTNLVVLHNDTNTFYYRSSPFTGTTFDGYNFIGSNGTQYGKGGNFKNLKYPTTVLNLGPREAFLKEIVLNNNFDGYTIDKVKQTSYNDLTEMINLFSIIRIADKSFWKLISSKIITNLFSRPGSKVDADFAQNSAINSQLGVIPFNSSFYKTGTNPSVIVSGFKNGGGIQQMLGIFFSSTTEDLQVRDYISPGRTLRFNTTTQQFIYDYTPIKSQIVPNYRWKIDQTNGVRIFGSQTNEWATTTTGITATYYQKMDRIFSDYPKAGGGWSPYGADAINAKGYLFGAYPGTPLGTVGPNLTGFTQTFTGIPAGSTLIAPLSPNPALGGAPWYFYFGLRRGATAMDRFYTKYIGETTLNG
jgi:hypothetical protein